eukprot:1155081-Pelagomonas_calceolata.AAC.5
MGRMQQCSHQNTGEDTQGDEAASESKPNAFHADTFHEDSFQKVQSSIKTVDGSALKKGKGYQNV